MNHETKITVRGYECDFYGHVNNSVYLNYLEHARSEFLRSLGYSLYESRDQLNVMLVVVRSTVEYKSFAYKNEELTIVTKINKLAEKICIFGQQIYSAKSGVVANAEIVWVAVDIDTKKITKIPEELFIKLFNYEEDSQ